MDQSLPLGLFKGSLIMDNVLLEHGGLPKIPNLGVLLSLLDLTLGALDWDLASGLSKMCF